MEQTSNIINGINKLCNIYPNKSFSEIYLALTRVIEELPTQNIDNDTWLKAIKFCLSIPDFLFIEKGYNENGLYFKFYKDNKLYKIYSDNFYKFRIVGKKRKRMVFKYVWEEYASIDDILTKCEQ